MTELRPLSRPYLSILVNLAEAGGSADLNTHGQLIVGPTRHPLPGDTIAWMVLVSRGLVAGEDGKLFLTDLGHEEAAKVIAGRTIEASA